MFIALEGLSGCGKSSVAADFERDGWIRVSPPHQDFRPIRIRVDDDPAALEARHVLFYAGILEAALLVAEALRCGRDVIADSWMYRTEATHTVLGSSLVLPWPDCIPVPHVTVFLDCPKEIRHRRRISRGTNDPYWKAECENRSEDIREYYLQRFPSMSVVDASGEIGSVIKKVQEVIRVS